MSSEVSQILEQVGLQAAAEQRRHQRGQPQWCAGLGEADKQDRGDDDADRQLPGDHAWISEQLAAEEQHDGVFRHFPHRGNSSADDCENDDADHDARDPGKRPVKPSHHRCEFISQDLAADEHAAGGAAGNRRERARDEG
ncbi:hypothetical protein chiPu_0033852 [Chiloscyllium punctatum]|uniref:Uncharacterized protein n=1 Tax=Chiloscyllium punctatum TaxID=137246 RepID=A0A401U3L7_CHIPU|nr:hypothetical protein [Chiloscyllium punctatum]